MAYEIFHICIHYQCINDGCKHMYVVFMHDTAMHLCQYSFVQTDRLAMCSKDSFWDIIECRNITEKQQIGKPEAVKEHFA